MRRISAALGGGGGVDKARAHTPRGAFKAVETFFSFFIFKIIIRDVFFFFFAFGERRRCPPLLEGASVEGADERARRASFCVSVRASFAKPSRPLPMKLTHDPVAVAPDESSNFNASD